MSINITYYCQLFLEHFLTEIEVTAEQYEKAELEYKAIADWLEREGSALKHRSPNVYIQGSFRLGTAIRPISAGADLDIDLVCELKGDKGKDTQKKISDIVGHEIENYTETKNAVLDAPGKRCWTILYRDGSNFHMDILPSIPDGDSRRLKLENQRLDATWTKFSIAITDREDENYNVLTSDWPHSNPSG